jgi:hypothetical protein
VSTTACSFGAVLGALTEDERARIEEDYFERAGVLDRVCAAEDDLIDDYLSGRLVSDDHERFERYYLASPHHRTRVAVSRAPGCVISISSSERHEPAVSWWSSVWAWPSFGRAALVAALVVLLAGVVWMVGRRSDTPVSVRSVPPVSPPDRRNLGTNASPARRLSVTRQRQLAPLRWSWPFRCLRIHLRGTDKPGRLTIAKAPTSFGCTFTAKRAIDLSNVDAQSCAYRRGPGGLAWFRHARATSQPTSQPSSLASIDVPAVRLPPDDYIVETDRRRQS